RLNEALLKRIHAGKEIVMIIDEAQNLSFEVMEQVRLLSNLETDEQKLLQIILMGQPELKAKLREKRLRQLRQRVLVYYDLHPLDRQQTEAYVQHRLSLAGANGRPRFTPRALRKVYRASRGTPRMIKNLCDKALLSAYIRNADDVNGWDVRRAVKELKRLEHA
ncbi:MAG: ExeA family protein, partial [Puniceicoccales bacterium]